MGSILNCRKVSFTYRGRSAPALADVDFHIERGEIVGIAGWSGAGKSTLVRCVSGLVPKLFKGSFSGEISIKGKPIAARKVAELAGIVGTVFQDFEGQLFSTNVRRELAFGLENLGRPVDSMTGLIERMAMLTGLDHLLDREPQSLSGGQKQILALASVMILDPDLLMADEPATDLDPYNQESLLDLIFQMARSNRGLGLVEHDTERLLMLDRLVIMDAGRMVADGPPRSVLAEPDFCRRHGLAPPQLFDLFSILGLPARPVTLIEARDCLLAAGYRFPEQPDSQPTPCPETPPLLAIDDLHFSYSPSIEALRGVSLQVRAGEFLAILGANGSGKTTLVQHLCGLLRPSSGRVLLSGRPLIELGPAMISRQIGFVFQNPDQMLFAANCYEEVAFGLVNRGLGRKEIESQVSSVLEAVGLAEARDADPFTMTKGDRQKLAVAAILALAPEVLILDEPTTGLDAVERRAMASLLGRLHQAGHTIIVVTHAVDLAAGVAQRLILMKSGLIVADGPTREIFSQPRLLTEAGITAPACTRLGWEFGATVLSIAELTAKLKRTSQ